MEAHIGTNVKGWASRKAKREAQEAERKLKLEARQAGRECLRYEALVIRRNKGLPIGLFDLRFLVEHPAVCKLGIHVRKGGSS
jgi:hypothetical protein